MRNVTRIDLRTLRPPSQPLMAFIGQGIWSVSNTLFIIALARSVPAADFGTTSTTLGILLTSVTLIRGLFGINILLHPPQTAVNERRLEVSRSLAFALWFGAICAIVTASLGVATKNSEWTIIAISAPFLVGHEVLRCFAVAQANAGWVAVSDMTRLAHSAIALAWSLMDAASLSALALIWSLSHMTAYALLRHHTQVAPTMLDINDWWRNTYRHKMANGLDLSIMALTTSLYLAILGMGLGPEGVAGIRGAGTLMGPFNVLLSALPLALLPRLSNSRSEKPRLLFALAAPLATLSVFIGSIGIWLPDEIGVAILGETWHSSTLVLPIMGLEYAFQAIRNVYVNELRRQQRHSSLLANRLFLSLSIVIAAVVVPAFEGDAIDVAWAMVSVTIATNISLYYMLSVKKSS